MSQLNDFFKAERKRVFVPDTFFVTRVMARLGEGRAKEFELWDIVPGSARPVLAVALLLILCFAAFEFLVPELPQRGMVEAFLEAEQNPAESFLYNETDVPGRQELLEQLVAWEDEK
jgi:hypothetical protein